MQATIIITPSVDIVAATLPLPPKGTYSVYREREQTDAQGRDWADYQGRPRLDETIPVASTANPTDAASALIAVMRDASMGGHRYGRIEIRGHVVATVTRLGNVRVYGGVQ